MSDRMAASLRVWGLVTNVVGHWLRCVSDTHVVSVKESQAKQAVTADYVVWCRRHREEP